MNKNSILDVIWQILMTIPPGQTRSYGWLARKTGLPRHTRRIASLLKHNPYPVSIPCHRLIRRDGTTGGYMYGESFKRFLLQREAFFSP